MCSSVSWKMIFGTVAKKVSLFYLISILNTLCFSVMVLDSELNSCRPSLNLNLPTFFMHAVSGSLSKLPRRICLSVCPSVRVEQLGSHRTDFHDFRYSSVFRNSIEKIQVLIQIYMKTCAFKITSGLWLNCCWKEKCFRRILYRKPKHTF